MKGLENLPFKIREEIEDYFNSHKPTPEKKEKIIDFVNNLYNNMKYDSEEPVGIVTAQSLSEPATQMTMRTYHFAGTAGIQVTLGLPRMLEVFDARKEPRTPAMTVFLKEKKDDLENAKKVADNIKEIKLRDVAISTVLDLTASGIMCRLNINKIKNLGIEPEKMPKIIKIRNVDVKYVDGSLHVFPKKKELKNLHKLKYSLLESHVKGIKGISQVVITKEEGEWIINTMGSNLKKVFDIDGVDIKKTTTNNIFEIYHVLGTEAARNAIVKEAKGIMDEQGLNVDIRYILILADLMTKEGDVRAIGRYGISGQKASVLVRASFEETKKHLINASIRGEKDPLKGTVENIMMNQVAPIGTGSFELFGKIPEFKKPLKKVSSKGRTTAAKKKPKAVAKAKPAKKPAAKKKK